MREDSSYAPLCALSALIESKGILGSIHEMAEIPQKEVDYYPTEKLVCVAGYNVRMRGTVGEFIVAQVP